MLCLLLVLGRDLSRSHDSIASRDTQAVQTGCRSPGRHMQHESKQRTNRHCIPHADQAANVKDPRLPDATLRASVRKEKTKSPGGWAGLSAHVKMKNRLHSAKGAACSSVLRSRQKMLLPLQPTASIRTSIQRTGVQTGCRSPGRHMQHESKHRTNRRCIPHADQSANPYTSECEDHRRRQANLGRNSRQIKRFGSPFQAACRHLTLSVTSLCV